jgi:hypothetical protein
MSPPNVTPLILIRRGRDLSNQLLQGTELSKGNSRKGKVKKQMRVTQRLDPLEGIVELNLVCLE